MNFVNLSFALALASAAASAAAYASGRKTPEKLAWPAAWLSWLSLTAGLALLWIKLGRPPLSNQYESLLAMAWCAVPAAFLLRRGPAAAEAAPLAAVTSALLLAAASFFETEPRPLMPALRSNWLTVHVLSSMAAYACFALAAATAGWALFRGKAAEAAGPLRRLAAAGFALLTLGIATGSVWAERAWGSWWSWDPKETWSLLTWLGYAAALHLEKKGAGARKFAIIVLCCFGLVLFTYFGVNFLLGGLHSYAK